MNKKIKIVAIIIAIIIVIIAAFVYLNLSAYYNSKNNIANHNQNNEKLQTVLFNKSLFQVPLNYYINSSSTQLNLIHQNGNMNIIIKFQKVQNFDSLVATSNQRTDWFINNNKNNNLDFSNAITTVTNYNNTRFITTSGVKENNYNEASITAETDGGAYVIVIVKEGTLTEANLNEVYSIVSNANTKKTSN